MPKQRPPRCAAAIKAFVVIGRTRLSDCCLREAVVYWREWVKSITRTSMLKLHRKSFGWMKGTGVTLLSLAVMCAAATVALGQKTAVIIRVNPDSSRIIVEGSGTPRSNWSLRDSYAGVIGLGARIARFELSDQQGIPIEVRQMAPGQFASTKPATKFRYEVSLTVPSRPSDSALVSWLNAERGILMPGDLLPAETVNPIGLRVELPPGWSAYSGENPNTQSEFEIGDGDSAVIFVGKNLRILTRMISGKRFVLVTDSQWAFQDNDGINTAADVIKIHSEVAGALPCNQSTLFLLPFSQSVRADRWSAQTRGCSVVLVMGKLPTRVGALAQFGNALTHELFHLWIPNGVALKGDYDWFYEGFTLYQAARAAVRMDLITFTEFLNAIGRAADGYAAAPESNALSLVEASKRRWTGGASSVYSKAMVTAFLYDVNLRFQSKGKLSLDDVYRNFFRGQQSGKGSNQAQADGNEAAIAALREQMRSTNFVEQFIVGPVSIDLGRELNQFGLQVEKVGPRTRIYPANNSPKRQRDLLRQLGYNERGR